jgi:hypothetical protein
MMFPMIGIFFVDENSNFNKQSDVATKSCEEQRTTLAASVQDIDVNATLAATVAFGSLGFFFTTEAVRVGDGSVVIPFRYTRPLFFWLLAS